MQDSTADFYSRSVLLFFAILLNAFASALEVIADLFMLEAAANIIRLLFFSINVLLLKSTPDTLCITLSQRRFRPLSVTCPTKSATPSHSI